MEFVKTILGMVFAPAAIIAGVIFVLQKFFERSLSRDLEKFKRELDAELAATKARMESHLQAKLFEYQTKFSLYHQNRADFIRDLYSRITELYERIQSLIPTMYYDDYMLDDLRSEEKLKEEGGVLEFEREVNVFYSKNSIYLDETLSKKVDAVFGAISMVLSNFRLAMGRAEDHPKEVTKISNETLAYWKKASEDLGLKVLPLKKELEQEFRRSISADFREDG